MSRRRAAPSRLTPSGGRARSDLGADMSRRRAAPSRLTPSGGGREATWGPT